MDEVTGHAALIYLIPTADCGSRYAAKRFGNGQARERSMTYATVMVSLALDRSNEARLEVAGLAERFDARVIGIAAAEFSPPVYFTSGEQAQRLLDEGQAAIRKRITELESQFRAAMQTRANVVEWRCAEDVPVRFIVREARAADIIVAGQDGQDTLADPFEQANPSDLVMHAGRPVLMVPESGNWLDLRSILVAWKDTPEARRAIADALPMLRKANDVSVVEIVEDEIDLPTAISRVKDVVAWLSRHGVLAAEQVPGECGHAAAQLERIASEVGAGLIVAGAYGHSRFREWILGGVTRRLVNPSGRCSLLSR
jgi:nucleotide-binding universal stress UspA family protein